MNQLQFQYPSSNYNQIKSKSAYYQLPIKARLMSHLITKWDNSRPKANDHVLYRGNQFKLGYNQMMQEWFYDLSRGKIIALEYKRQLKNSGNFPCVIL